ncbi:MAG TPA: SDR family NAD(P)-dependent oxidoreductase, partial [Vicinamibacteria bacterium]|nr:SDR family NAD(P)-dependent oxidoreductase [Vicinamibacteria bacterium]
MSAPLAGRVAVVTGASRGLGRALAVALGGAGARLALAGRARSELEATARLATARGTEAVVVPTDVSRYPEVEALMR